MIYIGVDVGIKGALVAIDQSGTIVESMPFPDVLSEDIDKLKLGRCELINFAPTTATVVMERQWFGEIPGQTFKMPRKATATYARQVGFALAALSHCRDLKLIRPKEWQNAFIGKVSNVKVGSVQRAKTRWPLQHALFRGAMGTHYADAAWLAEYGRKFCPQR